MPTTPARRITSKGQITLPAAWRKKTGADAVVMRDVGGVLEIRPVHTTKRGDMIIFNADRDNGGKGIEVGELIKILRSLDK
ncbi:AbrB/MazE/SpoVT family DNA-binding domain-containing protein [Patescibacteria group bacterium]|nr:AbrB/MazE/SpoVT family DNA-binding domain-containing protein [Patescibacteria group bacterium]